MNNNFHISCLLFSSIIAHDIKISYDCIAIWNLKCLLDKKYWPILYRLIYVSTGVSTKCSALKDYYQCSGVCDTKKQQ